MPFKSAGWAAGEHELGKMILPRPSETVGGTEAGMARQGERVAKTIKISKNLRDNIGNPT
jgi:hypothetical protein